MSATAPTSASNGDSQSALMIGGLVAMLLLVLALLIAIASLMKRDSLGVGQSGEMGQAGDPGQEGGESGSTSSQGSAKLGVEAEGDDDRESADANDSDSKATPNQEPVKEPTTPEASAAGSIPPDSPEDKTPGAETDSETKEPPEEAEAALPAELPPGTRVIPLFSEPSAATAPKLEESNPFLEMGKANSVVFVIDKSSSMADRLARVISALDQAIEKLDPKQSFQLIFFDDVAHSHPQFTGLIRATKQNKEKMAAWVKSFVSPSGGTEPLEAALQAIAMKPDRIVILSDGEFNPAYVDSITQANSAGTKKPIRIDCIGLDEVVESLRQIAKQNGPGIYYQAR